jgi:hypothetical protein
MSEFHGWLDTAISVAALGADLKIVFMMRHEQTKAPDQRRYWPWLLAMALIAVVAAPPGYLALRAAGVFKTSGSPPSESTLVPAVSVEQWNAPLTDVIGKHFKNETVKLDGNHFVDCEFEDVTFFYAGTRPFKATNSRITHEKPTPKQAYIFDSHNPVVEMVVTFFGQTGMLGPLPPREIEPLQGMQPRDLEK